MLCKERISHTIYFVILLGLIGISVDVISQDKYNKTKEVELGKGLVDEYGCSTCHTPKIESTVGYIPDQKRLLSGHPSNDKDLPQIPKNFIGDSKWAGVYSQGLTAWAGPWGISFAANLTPDKKTGIGNWSKQNFISTIRLGIHTSSLARELAPAMPWRLISQLNDDELGAIYTYLMTLKPVNNKVPEHIDPK